MNPESRPSPVAPQPERLPTESSEVVGGSVELAGESGHESFPAPVAEKASPVPLPSQAVVSGGVVTLPSVPDPSSDDSHNPSVANDDDQIEKEWVNKAKQIIIETQNDPYKREQDVSRLQADYIKKRYGKDLGVSN